MRCLEETDWGMGIGGGCCEPQHSIDGWGIIFRWYWPGVDVFNLYLLCGLTKVKLETLNNR
jgi:hypothetical protein